MTWPLKQRWFWMLFFALLVTLLGAFLVVFVIVTLSPTSLVLALLVVVIIWFVFRSYRKWVADKPEEEREEPEQKL